MKPEKHTQKKQKTNPLLPDVDALITLYNKGLHAELESRARILVEQFPNFGFGWKLLGGALQMQRKNALPAFRKVAELMPDDAEAHYNLGVVLKSAGRLDAAAASYQQAVMLKPDYAGALNNLGNVQKELGQFNGAVASYRRALALNPGYAETHNNLGLALKELGQLDAALASFGKAVELKPDYAEPHNNLGIVLKYRGQLDDALLCFRKAVEHKPNYAEAHKSIGEILQIFGHADAARASYRRALELQPDLLQNSIYAHLVLPVVPEFPADIAEWREHYLNGIAALMDIPGTLELGSTSFYLAYHNADDRPIMEALCRLFRARAPDLTFTAPHVPNWRPPADKRQRIRVGFLSEFLFDHTIGKHYQGFIRHLDRSRFEVIVIHGPKSKRDAFRQNLDALADKVITLPSRLKSQQQAVAAEQLDVLFYPDIGMIPSTYFLAYARLAPVQATSWGHPDTSGLDTMDYYVAAVSNEPEGAEAHYTERLIRLNRLPCFYYQTPPSSIPKLSKAELGLPETGILYGCPQSLFKLHPDFDAVLAAIAEGDPTGHLVLPEGMYSAWAELLKARWARTFPVLLERVLFLPFMPFDRFMAVMAQMDVLLDPLHFGSGNTFYDAMVTGTPVVTWPGRFGRGRNVAAAYRQMGVADAPVAQQLADYAPLALALGRDAARRQALRVASLEAAGRELFEDMRAVREFESFLAAAVAAAGRGELLPQGWRPDVQPGSAPFKELDAARISGNH
jgi:protein O-GlcNAc transferase